MKITITTEDFKESEYFNPRGCPLHNALKRLLPNNDISVGGNYVTVDGKRYTFGAKTQKWTDNIINPLIKKANTGEEVNYTINIPNLEEEL